MKRRAKPQLNCKNCGHSVDLHEPKDDFDIMDDLMSCRYLGCLCKGYEFDDNMTENLDFLEGKEEW